MKHVILGAGRFSHAHLRVLSELGVYAAVLCKRSPWTDEQRRAFSVKHPNMHLQFQDDLALDHVTDSIVHVVTPSDQHLDNLIALHPHASKIFVEKPAVLLTGDADCTAVNSLKNHRGPVIMQDDWLSGLYHQLESQVQPKQLHFRYDVMNTDAEIDLITEIASHCCNLLSLWVSPRSAMLMRSIQLDDDSLRAEFNLQDIEVKLAVSKGRVDKSSWHCQIDGREFTNATAGGELLTAAFKRVINNDDPLTDWYKSSWLICKLKMHDAVDEFHRLCDLYYEE